MVLRCTSGEIQPLAPSVDVPDGGGDHGNTRHEGDELWQAPSVGRLRTISAVLDGVVLDVLV